MSSSSPTSQKRCPFANFSPNTWMHHLFGFAPAPILFRDENGDFKKSLIEDVVGMLSLYEAAHFSIHGEDVLDKAIHFTTYHLKSRLSNLNPTLEPNVIHVLNYPLCRGMPRLQSKYYIPMYLAKASPNDPLLELAIVDFNVV
ncbi:(-)-germacrene D synthase-like isoform X2 [Prosopis cineraria]|uniref:(-)-germacrene D synthase-like isoform X2 n=1 Tax=Prosopis cineraria TaxID=364024 RepID=UPI0024104730|nr:(-)-germacrene D synthase-like isoform X2 [Prosopis cineraria]